MSVSRRLAAVVVADVVGYSRLTERDESGTIERLRTLRAELIDPKIAAHGGRIVKTAGDGLLLEFPSATSALRCAIEVQREMGARNADRAADDRLDFRIGINLGDIVIDGDDILGDGVNVAARLEPMAAPGGICISGTVREHVREDLGVEYKDAGEQRVKNIARPVHVYRIALGGGLDRQPPPMPAATVARSRRIVVGVAVLAAVTASAFAVWRSQRPASTGPPLHSVLIAPFEVAVGDPALAAAVPKLTAEVIKAIGDGIRIARVTPFEAAAALTGKTKDAQVLGREANVRYVIEGILRPEGAKVDLTLRIADTQDGRQVGTVRRTVDRPPEGDVRPLVRNLTLASRNLFGKATEEVEAASGGADPSARELLARIVKLDYRTDPEAADKEKWRLIEAAIKKDPQLSIAWQRRAIARLESLDDPDLKPADRDRILAGAEADSLHAVELEPNNPYLWLTRGAVLGGTGNVVGADAAYQRALDLDSTQVAPLLMRANLAMRAGDPKEALRRLEIVRQAWGSTAVPEVDGLACGMNLRLGAYEAAIRDCERARLASDDVDLYLLLTAAYALAGDAAKAARAKEQLLMAEPQFTIGRWESLRRGRSARVVELDRAHVVAGLRKAGVPE